MQKDKSGSPKICYLCGRPGADSKDHVPPKGLFNIKDSKIQRLTLDAHIHCNIAFAKDEEYFRDVIIQQAVAFSMPDVEDIEDKIWRSWFNPKGSRSHQKLLKTAKPILVKSIYNPFLKPAIEIKADQKILHRVAIKIARGIIYDDTGVVTTEQEYSSAYMHIISVPDRREKDKNEDFWKAMNSEFCLHSYLVPILQHEDYM